MATTDLENADLAGLETQIAEMANAQFDSPMGFILAILIGAPLRIRVKASVPMPIANSPLATRVRTSENLASRLTCCLFISPSRSRSVFFSPSATVI